MRLLTRPPGGDIQLVYFHDDDNVPPYAILSHTWTDGEEVSYQELQAGMGKKKSGYTKICFCVDRAAADGMEYCWVDTCCIDKSTSDELSTAINSMFRWYRRAVRCYVYLTDVQVPEEVADAAADRTTWEDAFRRSRWFTRGWTLQELLAPEIVEFYSKEGKQLGSKTKLTQEIYEITQVPLEALSGDRDLFAFSIDDRISWASQRKTTKKEDKAYCLLGIFDVFLPLIYGEGEEHALRRLQEEVRRRQEGQGIETVQDVAVPSLIPFPRNELFTGREEELRTLEQSFIVPNSHRRIAIYGLGGCGKSAFAIEFAYRSLSLDAKTQLFWVPAISRDSFELAYREIGLRLHIPGITEDTADVKRLVKEALSLDGVRNWLMIVDNADDQSVLMENAGDGTGSARLYDYLPYSARGRILFTTRSRKAAESLSPSRILELKEMDEAQTTQLLARRLTNQKLLEDRKAVSELLESLSYLPLAITQAVAFINTNDVTVAQYNSLLQETGQELELFGEHFEDPSRYREMESTVAKTWHISFNLMRKQDSLAVEYLSFMACIDRSNIPQSVLPPGGSLLEKIKAIGTLKGYAFVTERQQASQELGSERFFDMHRLVHMAAVWWLESQHEHVSCMARAAAQLEESIGLAEHRKKYEWVTYLPHAIYVARQDHALAETVRSELLTRVGWCQRVLGQYNAAEATLRHALLLREQVLGPKHPKTLSNMSYVAGVLSYQSKYKEAELINRRVLLLREQVLGPEHLDTIGSRRHLAIALLSQGKNEEAESMAQQALLLTEQALGPEHPDTLIIMGHLAAVLHEQDKDEEAESIMRETLARQKKVLGPDHPSTLDGMATLVPVLYGQGKYEEAKWIIRQLLAGRKKVLGPDHPDTLMSMNDLAVVLRLQGQYGRAESKHRLVLARMEELLGPEHPDTLLIVYFLARVLADQECYDESSLLYSRASTGLSAVLGEDHPTTRVCCRHHSEMLAAQARESTISHREMTEPGASERRLKRSKLPRPIAKVGAKDLKRVK